MSFLFVMRTWEGTNINYCTRNYWATKLYCIGVNGELQNEVRVPPDPQRRRYAQPERLLHYDLLAAPLSVDAPMLQSVLFDRREEDREE